MRGFQAGTIVRLHRMWTVSYTHLKELGFYMVTEAALGADMVAYSEAEELIEKGFLTSSCCPAFVRYIKTKFPELTDNISHNLSPMATLGKFIKEHRCV